MTLLRKRSGKVTGHIQPTCKIATHFRIDCKKRRKLTNIFFENWRFVLTRPRVGLRQPGHTNATFPRFKDVSVRRISFQINKYIYHQAVAWQQPSGCGQPRENSKHAQVSVIFLAHFQNFNFSNQSIVIVISKLLKRYSKAKRTRAPAYSRALRQIKGGFPKGGQEKLRSEFQSTRRGQSSCQRGCC